MNPATFLPVTIELLIKSALISLAAALLARGWRGATAAQRHLVWLVALATVMLLPLTRLVAPQWAIPLQPAKKVTVLLPALSPVSVASLDASPLPDTAAVPAAVHTLPDWRKIVLGAWLSGTVFLLGYRLLGSWRLHRLLRRSVRIDDPRIRLLLSRTLSELGLRRRPEIRLSAECRVPITWGSLRPVMLLPKAALDWNDIWLTAALRHEAAHIRRYDYLTRWFAHVACAIYWPNPLVWLLARSLRVAQELAADDLVLRAGTPPEEYATQLVDAARHVVLQGFFVRQAVSMACPSTLEDRVRAIVDGRRDRRPLSRLAAAAGSIAIALALALSTAAQLRSDEQKPAPTSAAGTPASLGKLGPQIEIASKFIEIATAPGKTPPPVPEKPAVYSDPQFQVIIRALNQMKGVDLLSAPRVTTVSNRQVTVEILREFRYPTGWELDGGKWKSTKSDIKKCGITLDVTPRITPDGAIELHTVTTNVEFQGFVDLDNNGKAPAWKKDVDESVQGFPPVPAGHRSKPLFFEHKSEKTVTMESGQTVEIYMREPPFVQHVVDGKSVTEDIYRRDAFIYISPRVINPIRAKKTPKEGAAATAPPPADSSVVLTVDKSGSIKLNGEPISIDDLKTKLHALKVSKPDISIIVRGDEATPFKTITPLLDEIRDAGVTNAAPATPPGSTLRDSNTITFPGTNGAGSDKINTLDFNGAVTLAQNGGALKVAAENPAKPAEALFTKEWKVPPDMIPAKPGAAGPDHVSGKDWLISKGVTFEGAATAVYVVVTSRLIVRNTQAQLDRVDQIISASVSASPAKEDAKPAEPPDGPALAKAKKIIIPKMELREASVTDVLDFLRKKAVELDPDKTGVNIVLEPGTTSDARITMSLSDIPLIEAVRYLAGLASLELKIEPKRLVLAPPKSASVPGPKVEVTSDTATFDSVRREGVFEGNARVQIERPGQEPYVFTANKLVFHAPPDDDKSISKPAPAAAAKPADPSKADPGDLFLNAYLVVKEGEKLETAGQVKAALEQMQRAAQMFERIATEYPNWQPEIVAYRRARVAAALQQLQKAANDKPQ